MSERIIETEGFNSIIRGRYGYFVYNKNDMYIGKAVEKYGEYSESEISLFRQICRPNDNVVEVGANIGTHTVPLSQMIGPLGRIYAFEPQRIIYQTLCANLAVNSITNVEAHQCAAASEAGFIKLPEICYDKVGNFGGIEISKFNHGINTPKVILDDFLTLSRLKLLKIDVEGMECEVILGAKDLIKSHQPFLYVENDRVNKSKSLIELIGHFNYRMFWHMPPLFNENNFFNCSENLYQGIVSINMICFHESLDISLEGFAEVTDSNSHPLAE